ncbi:MAG: response regulator transcription factor [Bryobacteraceae bacterium]
MAARILVVEDESHLAEGLRYNLEAEGYGVVCVETGEAAVELFGDRGEKFDAVLLDVMLPGMDGFEVARRLRAARWFVPILMLTARGRSQDVMEGFGAGADDYLSKPFELSILLVRLHALLRRTEWQRSQAPEQPVGDVFEFAGRRLDFEKLELTWPEHETKDTPLRLTLMEAQLLRFLINRRGTVVSRKTLLEEVWGVHEDTDTRAIDNFVARLRKYIEDEPGQPRHLLTVRGVGYRFEP